MKNLIACVLLPALAIVSCTTPKKYNEALNAPLFATGHSPNRSPASTDGALHAEDFSCVGNGLANNDNCISQMLAACQNSCSLSFGPGRFRFSRPWLYTFSESANRAITVIGQGQGVTNLMFDGTDGMRWNFANHRSNSMHFRDFTLIQRGANVGVGIALHGTGSLQVDPTTFDNVTLLADQITSGGWATGVQVDGVSFINFNGLSWFAPNANVGTGVVLQGRASEKAFGIQYQFSNCIFQNGEIALYYGPYIQGVQIVNSQFTNMLTAIKVQSEGAAQLAISNSQIDTQGDGIVIKTPIAQLLFSNNLQYIHAGHKGISFEARVTGSLSYSDFSGPGKSRGTIGIYGAKNISSAMTIAGNRISGFETGIFLGSGSQGYVLRDNLFAGTGVTDNTNDIINQGGSGNSVR